MSGRKIVDAKPPTIVTTSIAVLRRWPRNHATTTANAASYSTPALAMPSKQDTAYSSSRLSTRDQASKPSTATHELTTISARPPCLSSHRPTGTAVAAAVSRLTVGASVIWVRPVDRSSCIGTRKTANAYVRTPYPTVVVTESAATIHQPREGWRRLIETNSTKAVEQQIGDGDVSGT